MPDQWLIDYSQYSTQSGLPSDHQFVTFMDNTGTCDIVEFEGKSHLRISNGYVSVSLTNMDFSDDVDIIHEIVFRWFSNLGIGHSNQAWGEGNWYLSEVDEFPRSNFIYRGNWATLISVSDDNPSLDTRIRHRFRKSGSTLQYKWWLADDPQPVEWNATVTDNNVLTITTPPWWGGGSANEGGEPPAYIAWVGVGLNGADAPILSEQISVASLIHSHLVGSPTLVQSNALNVSSTIHNSIVDHITLDAGIQPASDVVATAINHSRVDLSWTKSVGATQYVIQRIKIVD